MLTENEFFKLFLIDDNVMIHTKKTGFLLKSFDIITREHPRLKINSFPSLRKALSELDEDHIIGIWLPLVEMAISSDKMDVQLIANVTVNELDNNRDSILIEAEKLLDSARIIYGRKNLSEQHIVPGVPIIAAKGTEPIKGADAIITYIERPERKPVIREDGLADYYEMNFVFPISEGDWLGEKILPQDGINGMDVFGNVINAPNGTDDILRYDRKSVFEESEAGKIVIRATHGGALEYKDGIVSVGQHLIIDGDVGPETGAINFDGSVSNLRHCA